MLLLMMHTAVVAFYKFHGDMDQNLMDISIVSPSIDFSCCRRGAKSGRFFMQAGCARCSMQAGRKDDARG
jgi:hypothetical protein